MSINYRTRLLLGFLGLAIIASGLVFFLSTQHSREMLRDQIRSTVISIAVEAAAEVDVELHESIQAADDESGDAYREIQSVLRAVRDRNRLERLFGFDYRNEMFVPAAKRRWGYYVYPILEGDRFVGRIEIKANRRAKTLTVLKFWPEPGVPDGHPPGRQPRWRRRIRRSRRCWRTS